MLKHTYYSFASIAILSSLALVPALAQAPAPANDTRVKIGSNYVSANGCHDTTQTFTTGIPQADKLDTGYHGVLGGIEVVETTGVGTHAYRNFTFINGNGAITYQLYAKGPGNWVDPPVILGQKIGGGYCNNAAGASEGIDIYAHYKAD